MSDLKKSLALAAFAAALATPALAHTGVGATSGFGYGFAHPLGGLDHVLAMVAVGLLAAQQGGRALWLLPAMFVGAMVVGGWIGLSGVALPAVELGIKGSIVVFGLALIAGHRLPAGAAAALVGVFALFHGHAHGTEMPGTVAALAYGAGFVAATAILHGVGLAIGRLATAGLAGNARWVERTAGASLAIAGLAILVI